MDEIVLGNLDHLLAIVFGILLPYIAVFHSQPELKNIVFDTTAKIQVYYSNSILQWIGVIAIGTLWYFKDRSFIDLGLGSPQMTPIAWGLILGFIIWYVLDTWWELRNAANIADTKEKWRKNIPFLPENWQELRHFFFVAFTAGVCEEIIFRGFCIQYFLAWNQDNLLGTWLSILLPAFLFSIGHVYQGFLAVLKTLFMAILLGWVFILTKSLWIPILLHFLVDVISGYVAMKVLEKDQVGEGNR